MDSMTFCLALKKLKEGHRIGRMGWNGTGMWLVLQQGYPEGIAINSNTAKSTGYSEGTILKFRPYILMKTAQGDFVPWLASQTDLLSEDWVLVETPLP